MARFVGILTTRFRRVFSYIPLGRHPLKQATEQARAAAETVVVAAHPYFECHKRESLTTGHRRPIAGQMIVVRGGSQFAARGLQVISTVNGVIYGHLR
jgi:hypothetical protein